MQVSNNGSSFLNPQRRTWLYKKRYEGLNLVSDIRRLIRKGEKPEEILNLIRISFNACIQDYLHEESVWILPILPVDNQIRKWVEMQHAELIRKVNLPEKDTQITVTWHEDFVNMLEDNIRFEIRTLFPLIEETVNLGQLENTI